MEQDLKLFTDFISNNKILIVDKSKASRNRIKNSFNALGADFENVFATDDYTVALNFAKENKPKLILSDYMINGGSGFDLFKEYKANFLKIKDTICILITSNSSQSTVAQAAEEDVDSFLIKPYSMKKFNEHIEKSVLNRINPSKYTKTIEVGKELMFSTGYKEAMEIFKKAMNMTNEPSLAYFYHGQAEYLLNLTSEAEDSYKLGLKVNKIHFKCQIGLYEILKGQARYEEAYEVVRNVSRFFPANPERLAEVIKLAIITENYQDILEYYNVFILLENRTEALSTHVAAGMFISGKFQFLNNHLDSAYIFFEKVSVSFSDNSIVMNKILHLLIKKRLFSQAETIFRKYPVGLGDGNFELFEYLIMSRKYQNFEKIHKGELLFNNIKKDFSAVSILLRALLEKGDQALFKKYLDEASQIWPKITKTFQIAA